MYDLSENATEGMWPLTWSLTSLRYRDIRSCLQCGFVPWPIVYIRNRVQQVRDRGCIMHRFMFISKFWMEVVNSGMTEHIQTLISHSIKAFVDTFNHFNFECTNFRELLLKNVFAILREREDGYTMLTATNPWIQYSRKQLLANYASINLSWRVVGLRVAVKNWIVSRVDIIAYSQPELLAMWSLDLSPFSWQVPLWRHDYRGSMTSK